MSTRPITTVAPSPVDRRPRVTVLAGFSPHATEAVARSLLVTDPRLLLVRHDLTRVRDGHVRRIVRTATTLLEDETVHLVHGCVACTLSEDVLPTLVRLSRTHPASDVILALPGVVEPESLARCAAGAPVRFDSYVTVVEADGFLDELSTTDDLRDRGLHAADEDRRSVASVVARQVEYADTIVVWGRPDHRTETMLHHLAPWATQLRVGDTTTIDCTGLAARVRGTGRHDPRKPGLLGRALEGYPIGVHDPGDSMLFRARRPFHPQRLFDALPELTGEALRGRGQLWLATQPDVAIGWESAGGGISLTSLGYWLDALDAERWDEASDLRRLAADLDWDPYHGDRRTVLAFIGLDGDADDLTARLTDCLITDDELAGGSEARAGISDPFAGFFPVDPEED
ncbi:CobW family GTP-binding protein [Actinoplanes friuliensis]|jgi:G3E family GTPase|uniref:Putative cobalamin synthesis CobW-like protein n=1 Tax=Actinoplanes friuliensis DSM 7358 TaxID=1246995 RepID=U5VYZ7_9ACTN|nr:GTP-binding protein [Actinoplanes friuliensis]AGZ42074.1 putative cobalamin synthesis CobW-like protein [Actinoplanes friuliensis DSM 7358]